MAKFLEVGDHVWYEIGGAIGLVIEVKENKALVEYYWGDAYWYDWSELVRTHSPLSK